MGCCQGRIWQVILFIFSLTFYQTVGGSETYDPLSLDILVHDHAAKAARQIRHTGTLSKVSLPDELSGMEASVLRQRSSVFWEKGGNFTSFYIPPGVSTFPFVHRLVLVFQNLGNWSTYYYKVPDHSLVAPVVGFMAYDASNASSIGNETLRFTLEDDSISVHFPQIVEAEKTYPNLKCVRFSENGLIEFMDLAKEYTCTTRGHGHFSIVVPSSKGIKIKTWVWWVVGIGAGVCGLVLLSVIVVTLYKILRSRSNGRRREDESENGVAFDTTRVGTSRMPSASTIRTQPSLEHAYVP